ncbi:MAG TPA: hypothetical protein VGD80_16815 [Kofleriaceae bacterium]
MRFEISRRARRQIEKIHTWWTDHRPEARSMFLDEVGQVELMLYSVRGSSTRRMKPDL